MMRYLHEPGIFGTFYAVHIVISIDVLLVWRYKCVGALRALFPRQIRVDFCHVQAHP